MKTFSKVGHSIYWGIVLFSSILALNNIDKLSIFLKPLLMPVLFITIINQIHPRKHTTVKWILAGAFLLCMVADILAVKQEVVFFSLILYSIGHILFSLYFFSLQKVFPPTIIHFIIAAIVFLLIPFLIFRNNEKIFGGHYMEITFIGLSFAILTTSIVNVLFNKNVRSIAIENFFPGAFFWILSYCLFIANFFIVKESNFNVFGFLAYASGQFYFSKGFIEDMLYDKSQGKRRKKKSKEKSTIAPFTQPLT